MNRFPIRAVLLCLAGVAVCAPAQEARTPQPDAAKAQEAPKDGREGAEAQAPPAPPAQAGEDADDEEDEFVPSQELQAEDEVTFPVDI